MKAGSDVYMPADITSDSADMGEQTQVQVELMQGMWSREELALPGCQAEIGTDGCLLWCAWVSCCSPWNTTLYGMPGP